MKRDRLRKEEEREREKKYEEDRVRRMYARLVPSCCCFSFSRFTPTRLVSGLSYTSSRQAAESRLADEETKRRIEDMVSRRVAEQVEECRRQMENEVQQRVEEAQRVMQLTMKDEMERKMKERTEEFEAREVRNEDIRNILFDPF